MGLLTTILELPQFLSYMFLPTLTEEERESQNIPLLVLIFMLGAIVGMFALSFWALLQAVLQ